MLRRTALLFFLMVTSRSYPQAGALDLGFNDDGKLVWDANAWYDQVNAVLALPDGHTLGAGWMGDGNYAWVVVQRLLPDGAPDLGFGSAGIVFTPAQAYFEYAHGVGVQSTGNIIVAGLAYDEAMDGNVLLARLLDNGSFDPAFAGGQLVFTDVSGSHDRAFAMDLTPANGIVVAGSGQLAESATAYVRYHNDLSTTLLPDQLTYSNTTVHPNPTSAEQLVTVSGIDRPVMGIALIAQDGRRVVLPGLSWHYTSDHRVQISIPPLASGLYTVELVSPGTTSYARVMVQD